MEVNKNFKRTEVGVLPIDWEVDSIGNNSTSSSGSTPLRALHDRYYKDGTIHWTKTLDLNNSLIRETQEKVTQTAINETSLRIYPEDSVLVAMYGGFGQIGRTGLLKVPSCVNQALTAITPNPKKLNSEYLLRSLNFRVHYWRSVASSSRKDPNISGRDVREFLLPLPGIKEQEAIAKALSDADAYIESLEKLIAKKRMIKKGVMQELLTGRKRLVAGEKNTKFKDSEIGLVPDDWSIKSISQIGEVGRGRVINHNEISRSFSSLYPVYSSQTSNQGIMGFIDTYDFEGEYITWTTDGANAGTVFHRSGRFNCTNVCGTIKTFKDDTRFIAYQLGNYAKSHVSRQLGNPKLMNDVMKKVKIPIPADINEQKKIASCISDLEFEINQIELKIIKVRLIKHGIMQELLTGRIRLV